MKITSIKVRLAQDNTLGSTLAWVSMLLEGKLFLNNMMIKRDHRGALKLHYPFSVGSHHHHIKPVSAEVHQVLQDAAVTAYVNHKEVGQ